MSHKVVFHSEADDNIYHAALWYEEQSEGLGIRFMAAVETYVNRISVSPQQYQKKQLNFREAKIDKFPFVIVFEFAGELDTVFIHDVFHTSQEPSKKHK